jgi:hypothetical protein
VRTIAEARARGAHTLEISDNTPKEQLAASTRGAKNAESVALTTDEVERPRVGTNHEGPVEMPDKEYPSS